jgi:hypothetical protein
MLTTDDDYEEPLLTVVEVSECLLVFVHDTLLSGLAVGQVRVGVVIECSRCRERCACQL